jgi:proton-translocating NAD(P)+ transhydrogenase subunit alpha
MRIGVPRESIAGERRVALVPETLAKLIKAGAEIIIERGAGEGAGLLDAAYEAAGARIGSDADVWSADLVLKVQRPTSAEVAALKSGGYLLCYLNPATGDQSAIAGKRVTAFALELVPRTTLAQAMDTLSSQATLAGYKGVLLGAAELPRILPMLTTAAGTLAPAKVFVIGAGVAGLQAIATARRLGGVVSGFDVRAAAREQIGSLGATPIGGDLPSAEGSGGYAKELAEEQARQVETLLAAHIAAQDLVLTTAQVPGRPAPRLITEAMVRSMKPGSVIVDLAAESGGNCVLTKAGETIVAHGVRILGPVNLPATLPLHASQMFSRNVSTFVLRFLKEGAFAPELTDEIAGPMCVTHGGQVRSRGN